MISPVENPSLETRSISSTRISVSANLKKGYAKCRLSEKKNSLPMGKSNLRQHRSKKMLLDQLSRHFHRFDIIHTFNENFHPLQSNQSLLWNQDTAMHLNEQAISRNMLLSQYLGKLTLLVSQIGNKGNMEQCNGSSWISNWTECNEKYFPYKKTEIQREPFSNYDNCRHSSSNTQLEEFKNYSNDCFNFSHTPAVNCNDHISLIDALAKDNYSTQSTDFVSNLNNAEATTCPDNAVSSVSNAERSLIEDISLVDLFFGEPMQSTETFFDETSLYKIDNSPTILRQNKRKLYNCLNFSKEFQHNLQIYRQLPNLNIPLERVFDLAVKRNDVLIAVDKLTSEGSENADNLSRKLDFHLKDLHFGIAVHGTDLTNRSSEYLLNQRLDDVFSHFALMIAYADDLESCIWFQKTEISLFRYRFELENELSIRRFLQCNDIAYSVVSREIESELHYLKYKSCKVRKENICGVDFKNEITDEKFYQVTFKDALTLIKCREAILSRGSAFVRWTDFKVIVSDKFLLILRQNCKNIAKLMSGLCCDERLSVLKNLPNMRKSIQLSLPISVTNLDELSVISFPPCMRRMYECLVHKQHLSNNGRMQIMLFLKHIGMSLENALKFWLQFTGSKNEMYREEINYTLLRLYGKAGSCTNYCAYYCKTLINKQYQHSVLDCGCPFSACNFSSLQTMLNHWNVSASSQEKILKCFSEKKPNEACRLFFAHSHGDDLENLSVPVIFHPNQYFFKSQNYHKVKK
ncbi:DNA primase large subunit [Trichinella pseudospiralis]|uniref:DNA primase large subunit n=1 Tax=Trichinella pseudospiralis TaxID=6337 RepID=A0A0V1FIH2_TRIPS|nr:DNA primase large subunit [Trichinella pseudospiralis]